ncbi:MAG: hypothetical protein M1814_002965 [Vezdaea aestivalis]|nr:MAG: hypothetical protein M1814_002965 [Vezdaea aestivalis]
MDEKDLAPPAYSENGPSLYDSKATPISLSTKLSQTRLARITTLIQKTILPHLTSQFQSGLSRSTLILFPTDTSAESDSAELTEPLGFKAADNLRVIRLEGEENVLGFWRQGAVIQQLAAELRVLLGAAEEQVEALPVQHGESGIRTSGLRGLWRERKEVIAVAMVPRLPRAGEVEVKVVLEEVVVRTVSPMGLYDTKVDEAVVVSATVHE